MRAKLLKIAVFIVAYLLTIFLFGVLGGIFFQFLPKKVENFIFINYSLLSALIFLVAIPYIVSWSLVATFLKGNQLDNGFNKKHYLLFTILFLMALPTILSMIYFALIPRIQPYLLNEIKTDSRNSQSTSFPKPAQLEKLTEKTIDGGKYTLMKDHMGSVGLYKYDQESVSDVGVLGPIPALPDKIKDFWYDRSSDNLIIFENRGSYDQIFVYSRKRVGGSEQLQSRLIKTIPLSIYTGNSMLGYIAETKQVIMETGFGDGCGGSGRIWLLSEDGSEQEVTKYGAGCAETQLPRLLGMDGNGLVMAYYDEQALFDTKITKVYKHNLITQTKEQIIEIKDLELRTENQYKIENSVLPLISKDNEKYSLNLKTKELKKN